MSVFNTDNLSDRLARVGERIFFCTVLPTENHPKKYARVLGVVGLFVLAPITFPIAGPLFYAALIIGVFEDC